MFYEHKAKKVALKRAVLVRKVSKPEAMFDVRDFEGALRRLSTESVKCSTLTFQRVDDVHGSDSLSLGVLAISDGIADDVFKEYLEDSTSLLVDESGDSLDASSACQSTDGWLGDSLDVITQDFAMALGASFSQSLSSFAAS